jgi:hypothetical protein
MKIEGLQWDRRQENRFLERAGLENALKWHFGIRGVEH